jgi:tetratricopeptide (TPR) repeat protein
MPNRKALRKQKQAVASSPSNIDRLQEQLQKLIQKQHYRLAIEKAKNIKKMHPDEVVKPSEAEIWILQGRQEYQEERYRQAQISLQQAVALGGAEEVYYWLTKSLLATDDLDVAIETMSTAFENNMLTKEYAGCYLKLLFMNGASEQVAALLKTQTKRFSAAQSHWAKGILSLQAAKLPEALGHFQKMGGSATPGDAPDAWIAYIQQQLGQWQQAEKTLAVPKRNKLSAPLPAHPAIGRLRMVQAMSPIGSSDSVIPLNPKPGKQRNLSFVLRLIQLLDESNYHDAAHALQKIPYPCLDFPEVDALYRSVMVLAADHALQAEELDCTIAFLESTVYQQPFDIQIALKLRFVYWSEDADFTVVKRLLNYFITEIKQLAKAHPYNWPEPRLNSTLAHIHCWLTDALIFNDYHSQGYRVLQAAEQLSPESPEVIGRQGLKAYLQGNRQQAISLMTKALENGCSYMEVYIKLLGELKKQGDLDTFKDIRRRFGKLFDDIVNDEVTFSKWIEALSTQKYQFFAQLVTGKKAEDAALQACQIFVAAVDGEMNTTGRVGFNSEQAIQQWEQLLQKVAAPEQIEVIQAIFLATQLFAKRQKGLAALQTEYLQRLSMLSAAYPAAQLAYLVLWAVKGDRTQLMQVEMRRYLSLSPQPGIMLAQIQLTVRRYVQTESLRSLIDELLCQDAQNPQLLLAKATTYSIKSKDYLKLKEQGFELARRLQDAPALQAYREEQSIQSKLQSQKLTATYLGDEEDLNRLNTAKKMIHEMFGDDLPPGALEKMLPELMRMLENGLIDEDDDYSEDDEGDDYFDSAPRPLFGGTPVRPAQKPTRRSTAKKKR